MLFNNANLQYIINTWIGSSSQSIGAIVDTGSDVSDSAFLSSSHSTPPSTIIIKMIYKTWLTHSYLCVVDSPGLKFLWMHNWPYFRPFSVHHLPTHGFRDLHCPNHPQLRISHSLRLRVHRWSLPRPTSNQRSQCIPVHAHLQRHWPRKSQPHLNRTPSPASWVSAEVTLSMASNLPPDTTTTWPAMYFSNSFLGTSTQHRLLTLHCRH